MSDIAQIINELPVSIVEKVEGSVIQCLNDKLPFLKAESCPQDFEEYEVTHPNGVLLIRTASSSFENADVLLTKSTHTIEIIVILRSILKTYAMYRVMAFMVQTLKSLYIPEVVNLIAPVRQQFIGRNEELWVYSMEFSVESF